MAKNYFLMVLADSAIHRFQSAPLGMCFLDKVIDIWDSQVLPRCFVVPTFSNPCVSVFDVNNCLVFM